MHLALPLKVFTILLVNQGVDISTLSILVACLFPYSIKIVWAPFLDTLYFKKYGKRKTYIVPIQILLTMLYILIIPQIETLIQEKSIGALSFWSVSIILLSSIQDVAIDGWVDDLFENEQNRSYASSCQSMGQNLGWFFSEFLFIWLNSYDIISLSAYLCLITVLLVISTVYVHFFKKEKDFASTNTSSDMQQLENEQESTVYQYQHNDRNTTSRNKDSPLKITSLNQDEEADEKLSKKRSFLEQDQNQSSEKTAIQELKELLYNFKNFYNNPHLFGFCLILLTCRLGFAPLDVGGYLLLIQNGFPKQDWAFFGIIFFPIQLIVPYVAGKYFMGQNKELQYLKISLVLKTIDSLIFSIAISMYEGPGQGGFLYYVFAFNLLVQQTLNSLTFVMMGAFTFKIQDDVAGGTQVTMLASLSNGGKFIIEPATLYLIKYVPFIVLAIIGFIYQGIYLKHFDPKKYDEKPAEMFYMSKSIEDQQEEKQNNEDIEMTQSRA